MPATDGNAVLDDLARTLGIGPGGKVDALRAVSANVRRALDQLDAELDRAGVPMMPTDRRRTKKGCQIAPAP